MKTMLIATTVNDISLPLFLTQNVKKKITVDVCFFHEPKSQIARLLASKKYDYLYIRDPFNTPFERKRVDAMARELLRGAKESYVVDGLNAPEDLYFEDKWHQYQRLSAFKPKTELLAHLKDVDRPGVLAKKRISSRAKGIYFSSKELIGVVPEDLILQKKISIEKEYRVYVVFGKLMKLATVRRSKGKMSSVKVIGAEVISDELQKFCKNIMEHVSFDFVGLDIAVSKGRFYLLEVNRSCQFLAYFNTIGVNLAETFVRALPEKANEGARRPRK